MKISHLLLLISLLICPSVFSQSKKVKKSEKASKAYEEMKTLINSREFNFEADWATTVQGRRISLTSNANFLKFIKDSVHIYLPYFGASSSGGIAMISDGGIVYLGPANNFEISVDDKKKKISVDFEVSDNNDTFSFNMAIFKGGNTLIYVNSNYRTTIKYEGKTRSP